MLYLDATHNFLVQGRTLFVATVSKNTWKNQKGYQKFLICSVFIAFWDRFDENKHSSGSYVIWKLKDAKKIIKNYDPTTASNPSHTKIVECEKSRKRTRNEENWEQQRKNKRRASGLIYSPYKSYNPKINKGRSMGKPRNDGCRMKCNKEVDEETRKELFNTYWNFADIQKQRQFIVNSCHNEKPKRNRPRKESSAPRKNVVSYFLEETQVCQTMILNTFNYDQKSC